MPATDTQKFRIIYFSGTGNTAWVVNAVENALNENGHQCLSIQADRLQAECGRALDRKPDVEKLRARLAEFLHDESVLVIAYPTYASDIPLPLRELLPLLPEGQGRGLAVISTILMAGGDACLRPSQILNKKGYSPFLATYVRMPNNIKIPGFDFFELKNGDDLKPFYQSAGSAVEEIVKELTLRKAHQEGRSVADYLLGASQRLGESFFGDFWIKHFFADAKCRRCGLCASICPMANISFAKGYPDFGKECCVCLRCYNFCPEEAVQITDKTMDRARYVRYKGFDGYKPPLLRSVSGTA
jgi:ferredoxin/flavodoxin